MRGVSFLLSAMGRLGLAWARRERVVWALFAVRRL